ncbi:MAG: ABC transporter permease [Acidobacteriia bacterium]|nr:ABC transporter permease [Terriglobia bacterium]
MPHERIIALWLRVKALVHRAKLERDLDEELAFHLAMRAAKLGGGPAAHLAARRQFGNPARLRETCRELWTFAALDTLWQDLRYAVRTLAKTPAFTVVAVLSLALGIGANTALFSLADVMLLRALPVKNPQELVQFVRTHPDGAMMTNLPYSVYTSFRQDRSTLADVFAFWASDLALRSGGATDQATAHRISGGFFPALGVNALLGRTIAPEDDRPGAASRVAVLSHAFWSRRMGSDPAILGATVRLSDEAYTVVGVMPPGFFGVDRSKLPDLWIPLAAGPAAAQAWVLGRLKPGISAAQARVQLGPLFRQALEKELERAPSRDRQAFLSQKLLVNPAGQGTADLRWRFWKGPSTLKILLGLTGLVLLIACANLANLLMARAAARSREIAIRLALGAGRWRIVRQLLTESLLVSLSGGALGLLAAVSCHGAMLGFLIRDPQSAALDFRLDYRLPCVALALAMATALVFGLAPAIRATGAASAGALNGKSRQRGAAQIPLAKGVLAVQMALSLVLLVGAGLFARSLRNLGAADLGFARDRLLLADVSPSAKTPAARQQFWTRLMERLPQLPGVSSLALAGDAVFGNGGWNQSVWIERPGQPARETHVSENHVSAGFFAAAGIPVLAGREFGAQDRENAPPVALVNRSFARRFFGGDNAIGQRFGDRGPASSGRYTVVGVVGDAKYGTVRERMRPMVFHPLSQEEAMDSLVLHVRSAFPPAALAPSIRREIRALDSDVLITEVRTLPQEIRGQLRQDRMFATLAGFFALLALSLGAIGIYGMVAYRVAHRTAEIGVRMALGAQRSDVLWLIMRETCLLLAGGAVLGVPAALAAARLVKSLLFGLGPSDPLTIVCATGTLFAAGALAGFLPARRAASAEPALALRSD